MSNAAIGRRSVKIEPPRHPPLLLRVFACPAVHVAAVLGIGVIVRALFVALPGHVDDIAIFERWVRIAGTDR